MDSPTEAAGVEVAPPIQLPYEPAGSTASPSVHSLARASVVVGWGVFITTFGQVVSIGLIPLMFLLKNQLHLSAAQSAGFRAIMLLPWNFKLLLGLLSDNFPLMGTRRRHYLLLSTSLTAGLWLMLAWVPRQFGWMLWTAVALNITMVMASVVVGGLLVECGQKHHATGRLASIRIFATMVAGLLAGAAGGYLASKAFEWTSLAGAALMLSLTAAVYGLLPEPRQARTSGPPWKTIGRQLKHSFTSPTLWVAGGLIFLVQLAPGLGTPLFYYQTDKLHFSEGFIGMLGVCGSAAGIIGSIAYAWACRKFNLRFLLIVTTIYTVGSACTYLGYTTRNAAIIVETFAGLGLALSQMPLHDLASRATPRGCEAMGYAVMMSAWNIGLSLSDVIGSWLYTSYHLDFRSLVWINAGTTALVLVAIPFLPKRLVSTSENQGRVDAVGKSID